MRTRESEEMYLETILLLQKQKGEVRSVDIVEELNYAKSSVSRAVNLLKDRGYIDISAEGKIAFTAKGAKRAKNILERHKILTDFLVYIGVPTDDAESDACKIEHVISEKTLDAIKNFKK